MLNSGQPNLCPVCGYAGLEEPAYSPTQEASFEICPSCGTEFGYQDARTSHKLLRLRWIESGMTWHSSAVPPPPRWDPIVQLRNVEVCTDLG